MKYFYRIAFTYPTENYPEMDAKIRREIGQIDGSGYGMNGRDISIYRSTLPSAVKAFERAARFKGISELALTKEELL